MITRIITILVSLVVSYLLFAGCTWILCWILSVMGFGNIAWWDWFTIFCCWLVCVIINTFFNIKLKN